MTIDKKELDFQLNEVNKIIISVLENTNLHSLVLNNKVFWVVEKCFVL